MAAETKWLKHGQDWRPKIVDEPPEAVVTTHANLVDLLKLAREEKVEIFVGANLIKMEDVSFRKVDTR